MSTPDEWDTAVATGPAGTPPEPRYSGVEAWVTHHLLPTYLRQSGPRTWCAHWWRHPEALERLEALWRAWEALRLDTTTGMSVWWRDHADHHLPILLSPEGPFARCAHRGHQDLPDPLPTTPAPADWWVQRTDTSTPTSTHPQRLPGQHRDDLVLRDPPNGRPATGPVPSAAHRSIPLVHR